MTFARFLCIFSILGLLIVGSSGVALAQSAHERTQFGRDISVLPGEEVGDVTCFACNVRIQGKVNSDVTTFGGNIVIEDQGEVGGDTTAFGGGVRLDRGAKAGEVTVFGGRLSRDPAATVDGDVTTFTGSVWLLLIFGLPFIMLGALIALIVWIVRRLTHPSIPVAA